MRLVRFASFALVTFVSASAFAQDDASKPSASPPPEEPTRFLVGGNVGFVDASRRLGPSLDLSLDLLVRKSFGAFRFITGLRPHYERFGLGHSDDLTCSGSSSEACGSGSTLYLSQTSAHAASLEVPFIAELRTSPKNPFIPFVGVSPWVVYLRSTERARGLMPSTDAYEASASNAFLTLGAFAGVNVQISKSSSFIARAGFRFAPYEDIPGGRSSVRGEMVSVGYRVEL